MTTANPYAAPSVTLDSMPVVQQPDLTDVAEARRRLQTHLQNPQAVAEDQAYVGRRFRTGTLISLAVLVLGVGLTVSNLSFIALVTVGLIMLLFFGVRDLLLGPRASDTTPLKAFKHHMRAFTTGHDGYFLATLAPNAREEEVHAPPLPELKTGEGSFRLRSRKDVKAYARTFARQGSGFYRFVKAKKPRLVSDEADVATVQAEVSVTAIPNWAYITTVVLFVVVRLVGLIFGLVVFSTIRKTQKAVLTKRFIKGQDGLWYALHGGWEHELSEP